MPRAALTDRPYAHECCPNATERLRTVSYVGEWKWFLNTWASTVARLPVVYCPWCGDKLPRSNKERS